MPGAICLRLLAGGVIGRLVFTAAALPAAQPVAYLLEDNEVVFHPEIGSTVAAATLRSVVAFEVDDIDARTGTGSTVLGIGHGYEVTDPARLRDLAGPQPGCLPGPHPGGHTIAISLDVLNGHRLAVARPGRRWRVGRPTSPDAG